MLGALSVFPVKGKTGNWLLTTDNCFSMAKRKCVRSVRCPTCKKLVLRSDPEFPFCSERCRVIDLGKWASDGYVVSTPIFDPDEPEQPDQLEHHHEKKPDGGADSGKSHQQRH